MQTVFHRGVLLTYGSDVVLPTHAVTVLIVWLHVEIRRVLWWDFFPRTDRPRVLCYSTRVLTCLLRDLRCASFLCGTHHSYGVKFGCHSPGWGNFQDTVTAGLETSVTHCGDYIVSHQSLWSDHIIVSTEYCLLTTQKLRITLCKEWLSDPSHNSFIP